MRVIPASQCRQRPFKSPGGDHSAMPRKSLIAHDLSERKARRVAWMYQGPLESMRNSYTRLRRIIMTMAMTIKIKTTVPIPIYIVPSPSHADCTTS